MPANSAPSGARRPRPARSRSAWPGWRAVTRAWYWRSRATAIRRRRWKTTCACSPASCRSLHFPDWETLPYDLFSPHPDIVSQRVAALYRLPGVTRGVLVVPVSSLMQRLPPPDWIAGNALDLKRGDRLDLDDEKRRLESAGYRNVPQVLDPGDFAVRGALLDLFPMGSDLPYRIELFDDEIDTLRSFDPETQRSGHTVDAVKLLPAREIPARLAATRRVRETLRERFDFDPRRCPLYQDLKEGGAPAGIEYYLPLFFERTASLFEHLRKDTLLVLGEGVPAAAAAFWAQTSDRYEQRRHDLERPVLPPQEIFLPPDALREAMNRVPRIEVCAPEHPSLRRCAGHRRSARAGAALDRPRRRARRRPVGLPFELSRAGCCSPPIRPAAARPCWNCWSRADLKPAVAAGWPGFLAAEGEAARFAIAVAPLDDGFALQEPPIALLTERQLFPERAEQSRRRKRATRDPDSGAARPQRNHHRRADRARGPRRRPLPGPGGAGHRRRARRVPVHRVRQAATSCTCRWRSCSWSAVTLAHRRSWRHCIHSVATPGRRPSARRAEKVRDVAAELLEIQARRHARQGVALRVDRAMYEPFAATFPFEETADQAAAIEAVIADLGKPTPMDRVVCGDVGFGKTEVAVRAAFVAAVAGKQVAVLVPTTLLAEQHYRNFRDRYADWPIRVEVLSRFKTAKEIKAALAALEAGQIDVIVGTHKLLQGDVRFKDLGLVIVDEEQRFGVRQKEALKALRAEVHLLTLTATPIPRTLNMAMSGLRELSIIATPPATPPRGEDLHRAVGRGADPRGLPARAGARRPGLLPAQRSGHASRRWRASWPSWCPRRASASPMARCPSANSSRSCSTSIASASTCWCARRSSNPGIDIPSANTIIINRADRFGLAQLHQLRGRVGRSHHRAYAYLVVPDKKAMTADAEKRLEALASLEELGAGFTLATHDLEIRGAGELLGEGQSGQIAEIGFSLYTELLARAVASIRSGKLPDLDPSVRHGAEVELHVPALIPEDYLPDVHARLMLYKRIASAPRRGGPEGAAGGDGGPLRPAAGADQAAVRRGRAAAWRRHAWACASSTWAAAAGACISSRNPTSTRCR